MLIYIRWVTSTNFATYMLSRVVGGLSEGNVQLATYVFIPALILVSHLIHKYLGQSSQISQPQKIDPKPWPMSESRLPSVSVLAPL
jgi:hypothetical protein